MNMYMTEWSLPPIWLIVLLFATPGLVGMVVAGVCGWLLRPRKAGDLMLVWGIIINIAMYMAFIPSMNQWERVAVFDFVGGQLPIFAMYFCAWYLVIVGIAFIYRVRRDVRPNWNVNRWGN